jgi:hypothetical protein
MNPAAAPTPAPLRRPAAWLAVLLATLGFIAWDAAQRRTAALDLSGRYGVLVDAPARVASSPTGYAGGVRSLLLPGRSLDGYHWIAQTQAMVAQGDWRVRHADYDDPPHGRNVHWAQPFRWWLVALAWLDQQAFGSPWGIAIERASLVAGPTLLALALVGLTPWIARRFSSLAACWTAVVAVAGYPFYIDFAANYPDHHGLVNLCALVSVLALLSPGPSPRTAVLAGVAGGAGLWISAATAAPVLLGVGLGAITACGLAWRTRQPISWTERPALFRWWGAAGAATSLVAFAIEYLPREAALRLEVNHPLYAITWLAGAEVLYRIAQLASPLAGPRRSRDGMVAAGAAAVGLLLPLTIAATHARTFLVADPFLWRLHARFISEFQSLPHFLTAGRLDWTKAALLFPLLMLPAAAALLWRRRLPAEDRAALALGLGPATLVLVQTLLQIRWWSLAIALTVPLVAVLFRAARADAALRRWSAVAAALLLLPGLFVSVQHARAAAAGSDDDVHALTERDLAHWLRQRTGSEAATIVAAPTVATSLAFHGGHRVLGTLYWENRDGLTATAALYAARTDAIARDIVREHGITHLVIVSWEGLEGAYVRLARGLAPEASLPTDTFLVRLLAARVAPPWLRQVPFPLPSLSTLAAEQVRVYEVVPEQDTATATASAAECALLLGQPGVARELLASPELNGRLSADVLHAWLAWREADPVQVERALVQAVTRLSQAEALSLSEHIQLVALLGATNHVDRASEQLARVLSRLDDAALRQLPAEPLAQLVALVDGAAAWPDATLRDRALHLLPPRLRPRS